MIHTLDICHFGSNGPWITDESVFEKIYVLSIYDVPTLGPHTAIARTLASLAPASRLPAFVPLDAFYIGVVWVRL